MLEPIFSEKRICSDCQEKPAVAVFLRIRERFWYNSEKSFNNNSTLTVKRRSEVRKRRMIGFESAIFCEQRPVHQSAPLEKSFSLALVVFFAKSMRKAN